jgi:hypothetical protein
LLLVFEALPLVLAALLFFGIPIPKDWESTMRWLGIADGWVLKHAKYPMLFALAVGLCLGLVVVPGVWDVARIYFLPRANFVMQIAILVGQVDVPGKPEGFKEVDLLVCIENRGSSSSAQNWQLSIEPPGKKPVAGNQVFITNDMDFPAFGKTPHFKVPMDKSLYKQTREPVQQGSTKCGTLAFQFDGMPRNFTMETRLMLSTEDNNRNKFTFETTLAEIQRAAFIQELQEFMVIK